MMVHPPRSRRALPPPLLLGLGLNVALLLLALVDVPRGPSRGFLVVAVAGLWFAATASSGVGLMILASRHMGMVRRGLQVAGLSWLVIAMLRLGMDLAIELDWGLRHAIMLARDGLGVALLGATIGLAVAVWHRRPALALGYVASWGLVMLIRYGLVVDFRALITLDCAASLLRLALLAAVAIALAGEPELVDSAPAGRHLRRAARALRFGVGVMIAVTAALALLAPRGPGSSNAVVVVGGLAVVAGAVMFAWLGLAVLGAARERGTAIAPYPLTVAAMLSLWCGRMLLLALPEVCRGWLPDRAANAGTHVTTMALLAAAAAAAVIGAAVLAATLGGFARRHGLDDLRRRAFRHAGGVLVAALVAPVVMLPIDQYSHALAALVLVVVCVIQVALLAQLCEAAAAAVDRRPELPSVRVVST